MDRSEIAHILEILHFKKQLYNEFYPKNHLKFITIAVMIQQLKLYESTGFCIRFMKLLFFKMLAFFSMNWNA